MPKCLDALKSGILMHVVYSFNVREGCKEALFNLLGKQLRLIKTTHKSQMPKVAFPS